MSKEELEQLFENNSDCYADTWHENHDTIPPIMVKGNVEMAMTKDKFVEVIFQLTNKPCQSCCHTGSVPNDNCPTCHGTGKQPVN